MLLVIATLLPYPFQNIVMHLTLEKTATTATINIKT